MGVHEELRRLVERAGPGVLDEGDTFRAALDDYLAEDAATRGEVNLLVDAVRLGTFRRLLEQVDHGADAPRAVRALGADLARDRGTTESTSAAWALGALAFAVGRFDGAEVDVLRDAMAPAPDRPTAEQASVAVPGSPTTVRRPATRPNDEEPSPAAAAPSRRRAGLALLAVGLVVAVLVAGIALASGWGRGEDPDAGTSSDPATNAPPFSTTTVDGGTEMMKGIRSTRTYTLTTEQASSATVLANTTKKPLTVLWTEVVPKELADHVSLVTFEPATEKVLEADPIVFWRLRIPAGGRQVVRWTTELADDTVASADYLARLTGWHREAVTKAQPQITRELPAYVQKGDVLLSVVVPEPEVPSGATEATSSPAIDPVDPAEPDPTTARPQPTKAANRAPRLSLTNRSTGERVSGSYTVRASDPDGDSWSIVSVSGAPAGVGRSGSHSLGGDRLALRRERHDEQVEHPQPRLHRPRHHPGQPRRPGQWVVHVDGARHPPHDARLHRQVRRQPRHRDPVREELRRLHRHGARGQHDRLPVGARRHPGGMGIEPAIRVRPPLRQLPGLLIAAVM